MKIRYLPESPGDGCVEKRREPMLYLLSSIVLVLPIGLCVALIASSLVAK